MLKVIAFLLAGLVAGFAVATWWSNEAGDPFPDAHEAADELARRVDALETALRAEERGRLELERALDALRERIVALPALGDGATGFVPDVSGRSAELDETALDDPAQTRLARPGFGGRSRERIDNDMLVERFVSAGIAVDRAQWIVRRSEELRMQALQAQYEAARTGTPVDARAFPGRGETLRAELGDADYERYLQALDRPTSVYVRDVLASSPGAQAGLQPGDQVVAYGGERVFDVGDLNRRVLEGEPGQLVAVEVLRDGQTLQLYVPRGPIGITGGGRFRRGP